MKDIDFKKGNGLVPVIIQDEVSLQVLMLGYMNSAAYAKTKEEGKVTFYSRTKGRLWTKGETSGHFLYVKHMALDCDQDSLLIQVSAVGPSCHKGSVSCFGGASAKGMLYQLEEIIEQRIAENNSQSYTKDLLERGMNKVAQKVGEEAVEVVIEALGDNEELFKGEAADLLYHFLVLLKAKEIKLEEVEAVLRERNR